MRAGREIAGKGEAGSLLAGPACRADHARAALKDRHGRQAQSGSAARSVVTSHSLASDVAAGAEIQQFEVGETFPHKSTCPLFPHSTIETDYRSMRKSALLNSLLGNSMASYEDRVAEVRTKAVLLAGPSRRGEAHVPSGTTLEQAAALMAWRLDDARALLSNSRIWRWVVSNPLASLDESAVALPRENRSQLAQERRICLRAFRLMGVGLDILLEEAIATASQQAEQTGAFEVSSDKDARQRVFTNLVRRQGQPKFRRCLLEAYEGKCAVTGCAVPEVLEAAHVRWYLGEHTNAVVNGLLLRADIHTLFDLGKLSIDPDTLIIRVSSALRGTEYEEFDGKPLRRPSSPSWAPSRLALEWHRNNLRDW